MELTQQRGAFPIVLDRPRILFFDMAATGRLIQKYGQRFLAELYTMKDGDVVLKDITALAFFLYAGLQRDAERQDAPFTLEDAEAALQPFTYSRIFNTVILALTGATATPIQKGKAEAPSQPASSSARATAGASSAKRPKHPGATMVSTSMKRSGSRSTPSRGRQKPSGR